MADTSNPFQDALNEQIRQFELRQKPASRRATSAAGLVMETANEYPRASLTAAGVGGAVYKGVRGWKNAYNEGLKVISQRMTAEGKMVGELGKKGITAVQRLGGGKDALHAAAREYALERTFTGFPFYNQQAADRIADLKQGRVILTREKVPVWKSTSITGPEQGAVSDLRYTVTPKESGVPIAVRPKQVTLETAGKIPKLVLQPTTTTGEPAAVEAGLKPYQNVKPSRTKAAPKYRPKITPNPSIGKRVAELSTGGGLGRVNIGLEAAAGLYDLAREEGPVRTAYRSAADQGEVAEGIALGTLAAASRAGRGAANMLTLGTPEYLGVYDTMDLLQVESEAKRRYMQMRGTQGFPAENYPVINNGREYEPVADSPYLQMLEAQIAAERGIDTSLMTENFYKGPEFNYVVQNGKVVSMRKPEYAALRDAEVDKALDRYTYNRPVLNVDPSFGGIGYQFNAPRAFNFGEYTDYMADR